MKRLIQVGQKVCHKDEPRLVGFVTKHVHDPEGEEMDEPWCEIEWVERPEGQGCEGFGCEHEFQLRVIEVRRDDN